MNKPGHPEEQCMFCQALLSSDIKIDIQLSTTKQGNLNVEEFIKLQVLNIRLKYTLEAQYLCNLCFHTLNTLEDFLIQTRNIQLKLRDQYDKYLCYKSIEQQIPPDVVSTPKVDTELLCDTEQVKDADHIDCTSKANVIGTSKKQKAKATKKYKVKTKLLEHRAKTKASNAKKISKWKSKMQGTQADHAACQEQADVLIEDVTKDEGDEEEKPKTKWCCEVCGKITNKANSAKHMNIHTKQQLFLCEYCNKSFTQKVDLKRHINIHMGIFPYICEFCGKKFAQHTSYDIHKKNHLGKRDFKCIVCEKGLLSKSHLVRHMKTHTKEKSFGCEICGKDFAERYNMTSHMKKVHLKEPSQMEVMESVNQNEMQCDDFESVNNDSIVIYESTA